MKEASGMLVILLLSWEFIFAGVSRNVDDVVTLNITQCHACGGRDFLLTCFHVKQPLLLGLNVTVTVCLLCQAVLSQRMTGWECKMEMYLGGSKSDT